MRVEAESTARSPRMFGVIVGRDLTARPVHAGGGRVDREVPAHVPRGAALLEVGEGLAHSAPFDTGVVAHPLPDQDRALIEQARIAGRVQPAAGVSVANRIRLELGPVTIDERFAPQ